MGASGSVHKEHEDEYRRELSKIFAEEFESLKSVGLTGADLEERFLLSLREKEGGLRGKLRQSSSHLPIKSSEISDIDVRNLCVETVEKIRSRNQFTWLVAVDGSEASDIALNLSLNLRKKQDHICVFHAFSSMKDATFPPEYKHETVVAKYDSMLSGTLLKNNYSFYLKDRSVLGDDRDVSVKSLLSELIHAYATTKGAGLGDGEIPLPTRSHPDFFILGYTGRKGSVLKKRLGKCAKLIKANQSFFSS